MKMYRVNVNGNVYDITLEVIDAADAKTAPAAQAAPAQVAAPVLLLQLAEKRFLHQCQEQSYL